MTVSRTEWYYHRGPRISAPMREGIFAMEEAGWVVHQIKPVGEHYVVVYHRES